MLKKLGHQTETGTRLRRQVVVLRAPQQLGETVLSARSPLRYNESIPESLELNGNNENNVRAGWEEGEVWKVMVGKKKKERKEAEKKSQWTKVL